VELKVTVYKYNNIYDRGPSAFLLQEGGGGAGGHYISLMTSSLNLNQSLVYLIDLLISCTGGCVDVKLTKVTGTPRVLQKKNNWFKFAVIYF